MFGADPSDYKDYIVNSGLEGQDVPFAFTLAYDFEKCTKIWNALYINLPMGFRAVDVDSNGNFMVVGYNDKGYEYILRHVPGNLPDVWKLNVRIYEPEQHDKIIFPGGAKFAFYD